MSSYRQPNFDLNAGGDAGPPVRPYNWVQWTGVALALAGVAIDLVYLAGRAGLAPKLLDSPSIGVALPLFGVALINSRREPISPEQSARQRRRALIVAAFGLAACGIGLAVAILISKGA
jgi:hypothetical protein